MLCTVLAAVSANATQITVGSYNIRVQTPDDRGANNWDNRRDYVARTVIDNGFTVATGFRRGWLQRSQVRASEIRTYGTVAAILVQRMGRP